MVRSKRSSRASCLNCLYFESLELEPVREPRGGLYVAVDFIYRGFCQANLSRISWQASVGREACEEYVGRACSNCANYAGDNSCREYEGPIDPNEGSCSLWRRALSIG